MGMGLLQPGFVRWAPPLLHKTTLTTGCNRSTCRVRNLLSGILKTLSALMTLIGWQGLYLDCKISTHSQTAFCTKKLCVRAPQYAPIPCKLTFDLLTLKVVSESRVTWATSVPILVFTGLSVLDLGPMYATDRCQTDRRQTCIIA